MTFTTPLVSLEAVRRETFEVGDLATANLYNPKDGEFTLRCSVRVTRIAFGNVWVKVVGLTDTPPYRIGDGLVIDEAQVIDW